MPFTTDQKWTTNTYRIALNAWRLNAAPRETDISPRKASTATPKHDALSRKLRSLLTWRAMNSGEDWTAVAANDNPPAVAKPNMDCSLDIRPLPSEIMAAIGADVEFAERREARVGGAGRPFLVPVGGDIDHGAVHGQERPKPDCVVRIGRLHFSNGAATESGLVLDPTGKAVRGAVKIPLGGLIKIGSKRPKDYFRKPKGATNDNTPITAGMSNRATPAAVDFVDPIADAQDADRLRRAVGRDHAGILDHALVAANFTEIGVRLGFAGKTAERRGKLAVIAACEVLEKNLVA